MQYASQLGRVRFNTGLRMYFNTGLKVHFNTRLMVHFNTGFRNKREGLRGIIRKLN